MIFMISSGLYPWQYKAPTIAPAEVPETFLGDIPYSSKAFNTPKWAMPLMPPPERAIPRLDL